MSEIQVGTRVVVRYAIEPSPAAGPRFTDALGDLTAVGEDTLTVTTRRGEVTIPRRLVAVVRPVPPTPPHVEARRRRPR